MNQRMVLDMCCGPRMMWFDKSDSRCVCVDRRSERHAMNRPKRGTVEWTETAPDVICDFTALPFADASFQMVVFDPPHFERSGKIGYLAMKYGWLPENWRDVLRAGFAEGFRVLRSGGTLIFKWTDTENPVSEITKLTPVKPLFGHKSGKQARTHWIAFLKPEEDGATAAARRPSAAPVSEPRVEQFDALVNRLQREGQLARLYETDMSLLHTVAIWLSLNYDKYQTMLAAAPVSEEMDTSQITKQLEHLRDKWRAKAATTDTFHATMGIGWKQCADELDTFLSVRERGEK